MYSSVKTVDKPMIHLIERENKSAALCDPEHIIPYQLSQHKGSNILQKGKRVGIAIGSRGIAGLAEVARITIRVLKSMGCDVFIIPAMGSHGGASPEGQIECLRQYGITEDSMGTPILSSMKVIEIGRLVNENVPVYFDEIAYEADGLIVINRIKPHTDFSSDIESGLMKMLAIGLGNHLGATMLHSKGSDFLKNNILEAARLIIKKKPGIIGIGIVEGFEKEIALLEVIRGEELEISEKEMLKQARLLMPCLPFDQLDVLVVDEIGKDISGTGMDTNVIGRIGIRDVIDPDWPKITRIIAFNLTEKSEGNAVGVGLADIITKKLYSNIDLFKTYTNCITSTFLERAFIPIIAEDEKSSIDLAMSNCFRSAVKNVRMMRIKNTLKLNRFEITDSLWQELKQDPAYHVVGEPYYWRFNEHGDLCGQI